MSPALAGRFFTTEPPGKPQLQFLLIIYPFTHSSIHLTSAKPCPGNRMEDQLDKRLCIITIFAFTLENSVSPLLYFLPRPFLCSLKNLCSFTCIAKGACPPHYLCPNPLLSSVQSLSHVWLFATPWTAAHHAFLSITNSQSLLKLISIELVMPSNHLILCCPLLLLPSILPSIGVFSNESALHIRCPKYRSFSFSISPSNEHPGLISFRIDWLDLLAVQGTLKSLLQHHSSKASILWRSAVFIVQLSHPYMTTGKTIALTSWTFVGKVMSLLFNMLSRLVIPFLPRSKCLLISWLQPPSAVILEPPKIKCVTGSFVLPSLCHEVMGLDAMICFLNVEF